MILVILGIVRRLLAVLVDIPLCFTVLLDLCVVFCSFLFTVGANGILNLSFQQCCFFSFDILGVLSGKWFTVFPISVAHFLVS